ncbi:bifunctional phosphoglucose/phosphomannose isomerase [Infirmifilum lucidum]|uniref:Bifunctional phosphoglucose/phosphomannose isomerase n=1 Tax=Infirmifilum lucidum TaxID=2776706 RepID=A0A7L9FL83_9CREN|nr:bifunctional phosphoglucose/phosphomannose isomerase [Infirmifilum lucidum]QOJ79626.1 bifunctional phosphoglucose/phosphomannose isomerase [Infirmifilum lucidum]
MEEVYRLISPNARQLDNSGMLLHVLGMPRSILEGLEKYGEESGRILVYEPEKIKGVVVSGMGGSFISGLFLYDLLSDRASKPILLNRDAKLPSFVDKNYLLVTVSYSGNTEETLRVYLEGYRRGTPIVAITSGGEMAAVSDRLGVPLLRLPPNVPPRAAFPYITAALASILEIITGVSVLEELRQAAEDLEKSLEASLGEGVAVARLLRDDVKSGLTPLVYGYSPYLSPAYRFKTQMNENAKVHAFFGELPEANHNEIMGWGGPLGRFTVSIIRGREEPEYMRARIEFLEGVLKKNGVPLYNLYGEGGSRASELLSLVFKVDVASVVLALLLGIDPTPVGTITELKGYLESRVSYSLSREIGV